MNILIFIKFAIVYSAREVWHSVPATIKEATVKWIVVLWPNMVMLCKCNQPLES